MSVKPYSRLGSKPKIRRDSERQIKLDLTELVSRITRLSTPYCVLCGESNWRLLEAGHYWHRDMPPTEFALINLNTLCHECNQKHEHDPKPYREFMLRSLGQEAYDALARLAHSQTKVGYVELFEMREQMRAHYEELKSRAA